MDNQYHNEWYGPEATTFKKYKDYNLINYQCEGTGMCMDYSLFPGIDLIFMDIRMPVMKGDEATMKIRQLDREDCKKIPIIAMTANALESDVENSYNCGMNGHISKPIEPEEVYRCLNKWLIGA